MSRTDELLETLATNHPATGDRVSFKALPEARGTAGVRTRGGRYISVVLDGTGERIWVNATQVTRLKGESK